MYVQLSKWWARPDDKFDLHRSIFIFIWKNCFTFKTNAINFCQNCFATHRHKTTVVIIHLILTFISPFCPTYSNYFGTLDVRTWRLNNVIISNFANKNIIQLKCLTHTTLWRIFSRFFGRTLNDDERPSQRMWIW